VLITWQQCICICNVVGITIVFVHLCLFTLFRRYRFMYYSETCEFGYLCISDNCHTWLHIYGSGKFLFHYTCRMLFNLPNLVSWSLCSIFWHSSLHILTWICWLHTKISDVLYQSAPCIRIRAKHPSRYFFWTANSSQHGVLSFRSTYNVPFISYFEIQ
jgi:hypothetical protein